jgi:glycine cleavage system H lipoate-binding protein
MIKLEMENIEKTKEIELLQDALNGMVIQVNARVTKRDAIGIAMIAGGAGLLGTIAYGEIRGWFLKRKFKKQMDTFSKES